MSWLSSFMHPGRAYDKAQKQLDKYYQQGQQYLSPYNEHGQDVYGDYRTAMQNLLNPAQLENEWANNYQESDLARQNEATANQRGLESASSMGLMGSSPALQAIQSGTSGIVAQDRQKYLDDLMQKYMAGIGISQDIYGKGLNSANALSNNAMNMGQNSAQTTFNKNNAGGDMFGKILGYAGSFGANALANKMGWTPQGNYNAPQYVGR